MLAEVAALEPKAAARARGGENLGPHQQGAHERRPQGEIRNRERDGVHGCSIGGGPADIRAGEQIRAGAPRRRPSLRLRVARMPAVSWVSVALLACALIVLIGAEWPRLARRTGFEGRKRRERARRKAQLKLLRTESDEFAASVERDLSQLPTIEERDPR